MKQKLHKGTRCACILAFSIIMCAFGFLALLQTAKAADIKVTESVIGSYIHYNNGVYDKTIDAKLHKVNGEMAYCVQMENISQTGEAKEVDITKYLQGDELVEACLAQKHIFELSGYTQNEKYMLTQCMIWYIQRDHIGSGGWRIYVDDIDLSVDDQKTYFSTLEKQIKKEKDLYEGAGHAYQIVDDSDAQRVAIVLAPVLKVGSLQLVKTSSLQDLSAGNDCYSLQGAVYGVYTDQACTQEAGELITGQDGSTNVLELPIGTYYVKEKSGPEGYWMELTVQAAQINVGETTTLAVPEQPAFDGLGLEIIKKDTETKEGYALGTATLENAVFTIQYYDSYFQTEGQADGKQAVRSWSFATKAEEDEQGNVRYRLAYQDAYKTEGDSLYFDAQGNPVLPLGTYVIRETKAPKGYLLNEDASFTDADGNVLASGKEAMVIQVTKSGETVSMQGKNSFSRYNRIKRGDFEFNKIGEAGERLANIPFEIRSETTGETHSFTTDANGYYSSASAYASHSEDTNGGEAEDGLWFGQYQEKDGSIQTVAVNDAWGALPYDGTYIINELPCDENEGKTLLQNIHLTISKEGFLVDMGTLTNMEEPPEPEEPETPETPDQPEAPACEEEVQASTEENAVRPVISEKAEEGEVKTGDGRALIVFVFLMILSCALLFTYGRMARKG